MSSATAYTIDERDDTEAFYREALQQKTREFLALEKRHFRLRSAVALVVATTEPRTNAEENLHHVYKTMERV